MLGSFLLDSSITSFERFLDHYQIPMPLSIDDVYGKKGKAILPEFDRQCAYMEALLAGMAPIVPQMKMTKVVNSALGMLHLRFLQKVAGIRRQNNIKEWSPLAPSAAKTQRLGGRR